jgi:hypothetical protein
MSPSRFIYRNPSLRDPIGQRRSFDQLQDERGHARRILETVDVRDVWVIQRRERLGLALEPGQSFGIMRDCIGET